jgi:hypothetical protein
LPVPGGGRVVGSPNGEQVAGPTGLSGVGGTGRPDQRLGRLEGENAALREQVDQLRHADQQPQARVRKLTGQVEELRRAAKRQAAPSSNTTRVRYRISRLS